MNPMKTKQATNGRPLPVRWISDDRVEIDITTSAPLRELSISSLRRCSKQNLVNGKYGQVLVAGRQLSIITKSGGRQIIGTSVSLATLEKCSWAKKIAFLGYLVLIVEGCSHTDYL